MRIQVFHGTAACFEQFKVPTSGLHLGTFEQAAHAATLKLGRLSPKAYEQLQPDPSGWNGRLILCELDVQRVLRVEDAKTPSAWAALIRKVSKDFDCMVYANQYEGRHEEDSYVVFSPAHVRILDHDYTRSRMHA